MISNSDKDLIEAQIIKYITSNPQSLTSLIDQTKSTSAKVSWICQNLRGKGIIILTQEGLFRLSESISPISSQVNNLQTIETKQSFQNSQGLI